MIHALIAGITCAIFALLHLPPWFCMLPAVWYMGREYAQAEYRWIEDYGDGKRANMPWYAPFLPQAWTLKGLCDWVFPLITSGLCYYSRIHNFWMVLVL